MCNIYKGISLHCITDIYIYVYIDFIYIYIHVPLSLRRTQSLQKMSYVLPCKKCRKKNQSMKIYTVLIFLFSS
jgi:hypothetical protein